MQTAASSALVAFQAQDIRADGASRHVAVDQERVSIARRYQGIDMRVAVPVAAYTGVVRRGGEVCLAHRDPDLSVTLCEACDDAAEVESAWRTWAKYLELPALVEGGHASEAGSTGALSCARRNRGISALRRPRFLTRRKIGNIDCVEIVHREDEIISYE